MISKKVVLIGDFSTGKTSLIRRFVDNQFSDDYLSTLGVKISRKNISILDNEVQNIIWDVEGGTENKPLNTSYLLGVHGAIIVADVLRSSTVENVQNYIDMLKNVSADTPIVIALNKCDLLEEHVAQDLLETIQAQYPNEGSITLTSAKNDEGVREIFESVTRFMLEAH